MKIFTALVAMVGLIAAAGLDSDRWVLCLLIVTGSVAWVTIYGFLTGWSE